MPPKAPTIYPDYRSRNRVTLHEGDALDFLQSLNKHSVQLIVTSPPYNIGKEYEERAEIQHYLSYQREVIRECTRVLKPDGSICWQTGNYVRSYSNRKASIIPLDILFYQDFSDLGFELRNRIVWRFGHGLHSTYRLSGRYEVVSWYTKTDNYTFNLDKIRVPQKYRGKRAYQGPNKGKPSGNPLGMNPSDYWDGLPIEDHEKELMEDLWDIPNVKGNHLEKAEHPCIFPVSLVRRLVKMLSNKRHLVVDPYVGTGTTLLGGWLEGRRVAGSDNNPTYTAIAHDRLMQLFDGKLRFREDKPVFTPNGNMKVAREPEEWLGKKL